MPNGHGGIPRFGSPILIAIAAVLAVLWERTTSFILAEGLAYVFAAAAGWRTAFHLTMWNVTEYSGAHATGDEKRKAIKKYVIAIALLVSAAELVAFFIMR